MGYPTETRGLDLGFVQTGFPRFPSDLPQWPWQKDDFFDNCWNQWMLSKNELIVTPCGLIIHRIQKNLLFNGWTCPQIKGTPSDDPYIFHDFQRFSGIIESDTPIFPHEIPMKSTISPHEILTKSWNPHVFFPALYSLRSASRIVPRSALAPKGTEIAGPCPQLSSLLWPGIPQKHTARDEQWNELRGWSINIGITHGIGGKPWNNFMG